MGQGLWRVARNQQLQQESYSEQGYLTREQSRRMTAGGISNANHRKQAQGGIDIYHLLKTRKSKEQEGFINLEMLPPELSFTILSYLNATDLCLASCVWQDLANDELLWQGLCKSTWGHCSIYNKNPPLGFSFRRLYMQLDEGSLTFNANPDEGTRFSKGHPPFMSWKRGNQTPQQQLQSWRWLTGWGRASTHFVGVNYFMSKGILDDSPKEIAKFIFCTRTLNWKKLRIYLDERRDVLDDLVTLHNFRNQFLPNALREFFRHIHAPEERGEYLETLITKFSHRFCACNPDLMRELGLSPDAVYVLCYSLILLSIDLSSPHVKNKMSKREFIRNTRRAAQNISEDFVGHLYDNIYLIGHVAA
ncbi:F-box only protein 8 isoform X3 [Monodelphis domestica]|uniref:F-box protein 8 n=2 Tax=Monodelphis domestica TaxID=13616 RepID=A0A5F8GIM0_MONDO|nr:F-box only protein 8 isoform X3 [Monodelphis domestica]XP_016278606.1 F-box only protein 8 isoform X3 [Monodelphis domestica]